MAFCAFAQDAILYDSTPIENIFIQEYLPTAPGDCVRVYLYLRMLALHPSLCPDLEALPGLLRLDADVVDNALTYWERCGLLRRMTDNPPTYELVPLRDAHNVNADEAHYYEFRDFNGRLQAIFGAEHLLHPKQYAMANDWVTIFGLTQEAVIKIVEEKYASGTAKRPETLFKKLDPIVREWAERGVRTVEDVQKALMSDAQLTAAANAVAKQLSIRRALTSDELALVQKWLSVWSLSTQDLLDACAQTTKSRNPSFAYLDSILEHRVTGEDAHFSQTKEVLRALGLQSAVPTPEQVAQVGKLLSLGFEPATLRLAAAQCAHRNRCTFNDFTWMADQWHTRGLYRQTDAQTFIDENSRALAVVQSLLSSAGMNRRANANDLELYRRWCTEHSAEVIAYAAECARGMQIPMRYIDKLLGGWKTAGVSTVEEARAEHARRSAAPKSGAVPVNPALNYEQRTHTENEFDHLVVDLLHYESEDKA